MPRLASQNKEIKDERRQSILNASLVVFALYGKDNTTVDLLTTASKCSHGLFYHYFKNVDQVYDSLFKLPKLIEIKQKILDTNRLYSFQKLEDVVINLLNVLSLDKDSISITAILLDDREKDSLFNNISYLIQKGQKEGDVTGGDPDDITTTFTYIFKGYCSSYLTHKRNKPMLPDKDIVLELFRRRSRI